MSNLRDTLRVDAEQLVARCQPDDLPFETTDELHSLDAVFGQERAVRAIEFALGMEMEGYNLYASGPDGIGKSTIVESFLGRRAEQLPAPRDWIYVHNFQDPDRPVGISLPPGQGPLFAAAMKRTVEMASQELKQAFESDSYARQRQELGGNLEQRRNVLLEHLRVEAEEMGFALKMTPSGIVSSPLIEGAPATEEQFNALPETVRQGLQDQTKELERRVQETLLQMRGLERSAVEEVQQLDEQVAAFAIEHLFEPLLEEHGADREIAEFLRAVRDDIKHERDHFRQSEQPQAIPGMPQPQAPSLRRYEVNALIVNAPDSGAPVITERHPTYHNLLGRIEYVGQFGTMSTDHLLIKAGSLAMANGGFLVVRLRDLLTTPQTYDGLKRALASGELAIENMGESLGLVPTSGLRPEPIPLNVKVVIVGDANLYSYLFRLDPDFRELFRVKADFEVDIERTPDTVRGLAAMIRTQCDRGSLNCFSRDAVARLIEHSSRMVEDQKRLSGNMGGFVDLVRQADFWSKRDGVHVAGPEHVDRALEERDYRSSLVRDRLQQMIDEGSIFIDTEGELTGQINALSVYDMGDITFGRPSRITCITSAGRGSIVNVERETDMAGRTHNKGFLIMRGFLADRFGQHNAMSLHASLTFEQLYGDIDGDSASSTELYALLSSLAQLPITQSIAVTGSVNQRGQVQPIGGATAKIEGFFEVCRTRGLDGTQGVMLPRSNVDNVILKPEVAEAVAEGKFHVWAVSTIEEGIEVLTGLPAGVANGDGHFPEGTVFRMVQDRLDEFFHALEKHREIGAAEAPHIAAPHVPAGGPPGIPPPPPPEPPVIV